MHVLYKYASFIYTLFVAMHGGLADLIHVVHGVFF